MYAISSFTIVHSLPEFVFAKNLFTGAVVRLTQDAKADLDAWLVAQDALAMPEGVPDLIEQGILVEAEENEYVAWRTAMLAMRNDEAHVFTLHFEPTLQCQLACPYS